MGDGRRVESRRRLCLVVDVERYSGRSYDAQAKVQDGVALALEQACANAGLRRRDCERQDRGDGQLLLLPPEIDEDRAVPGLILGLRDMLPLLNARVPEEHVIRLRVALAQGAVRPAKLGFVAWSVELASRLLDSAALRKELAVARGSDMALIVPDDLYHDVFERGAGGLPPDALRKVRVEIKAKKFAADAWLGALPRGRTAPLGFPVVPAGAPLARPRRSLARAGAAAVLVGGTLLLLPGTETAAHSADQPSTGHRAADAAETVATTTADHVVDSPHPHPHPVVSPDWGEHYGHVGEVGSVVEIGTGTGTDTGTDDGTWYETHTPVPYDHDTHDTYEHDTYSHEPDEPLPHDDPASGGFSVDPHHPDW
ncbi:hypothetical protein [Streptomyces sp. Amel2xC10]|uniref:hypothetical protein n=1 Tax=Streptomyces sp. Amel2xC10 TaxID=1305826 RepID=UPI000A0821BE|nr:hypothetical protein [Streptomyces sp. Amel2xC10]SMF77601.1 hypothetical protein SAMN02745830_06008 [Streptomyces sp. Amel2xC10]